jgi:hypothetical protein
MKDIILDKSVKRFQYYVSWILFILFGSIIGWIIAIGLASYGKNTSENQENKKFVLNKTYQKFIWIYGIVIVNLALLGILISIIFVLLGY